MSRFYWKLVKKRARRPEVVCPEICGQASRFMHRFFAFSSTVFDTKHSFLQLSDSFSQCCATHTGYIRVMQDFISVMTSVECKKVLCTSAALYHTD